MGNPTSSYRSLNSFIHVYTIGSNDIKSGLFSWQQKDLLSQIAPLSTEDLNSIVNGGMFAIPKDLKSIISPLPPIELRSELHGWATKDLSNRVVGILFPGNLKSFLNTIQPKSLKSNIVVYRGIEEISNLYSEISSFYTQSLSSRLSSVTPNDLKSNINSVGGSLNLGSSIIPKVIYISSVFKISLLESLDLSGVINCFCMKSNYKNLSSYVYSFNKKDLTSYIIGWSRAGKADTIRDLVSSINTSFSYAKDILNVTFTPTKDIKHSELVVKFESSGWSKTVNKLSIVLTLKSHSNLKSSISGEFTHYDLTSRLVTDVPYNFTMLPEWVNPKVQEAFIDIDKLEDRVVRFVDMMFEAAGNNIMQYFYIAGDNKVYKIARERKWSLWFTGYSRSPNGLVEKYNIRRKVLFDLTNYNTMDEAVRDLMSRCAEYNKFNLSSTINAVLPTFSEFKSSITIKSIKTWYKHLQGVLNTLYVSYGSLNSTIIGINLSEAFNLSSYIIGKDYEPPPATKADFNFTSSGYIPPTASGVDLAWTVTQSEEFWK